MNNDHLFLYPNPGIGKALKLANSTIDLYTPKYEDEYAAAARVSNRSRFENALLGSASIPHVRGSATFLTQR